MLDPPVAVEVEDRVLAEVADVHVAGVDDQLVALGLGAGDDEAVRVDDDRAGHQRMLVLDARLGDADHPGRVLVGAGGHRRARSGRAASPPLVRHLAVHGGRVVAEHDHLHPLQAHDAVDLRPAAVVADAHAHNRVLVRQTGKPRSPGSK